MVFLILKLRNKSRFEMISLLFNYFMLLLKSHYSLLHFNVHMYTGVSLFTTPYRCLIIHHSIQVSHYSPLHFNVYMYTCVIIHHSIQVSHYSPLHTGVSLFTTPYRCLIIHHSISMYTCIHVSLFTTPFQKL